MRWRSHRALYRSRRRLHRAWLRIGTRLYRMLRWRRHSVIRRRHLPGLGYRIRPGLLRTPVRTGLHRVRLPLHRTLLVNRRMLHRLPWLNRRMLHRTLRCRLRWATPWLRRTIRWLHSTTRWLRRTPLRLHLPAGYIAWPAVCCGGRTIVDGSQRMQIAHLSGPGRSIVLLHRRTINSELTIPYRGSSGPFRRTYSHRPHRRMGKSFHIACLGSPEIRAPISPVDIVNHRNIIDDRGIMYIPDIIITDIHTGDTVSRTKIPIICRRPVSAVSNANVYPGTDGRPTIIASILAPGDPGRSPFISRHPHPSIRIIIEPVAIMESGPTPTVIRDPCPSIIRIHPMTSRAIGSESAPCIRYPHIAVIRIADPGTERAQLIIEHLKTHVDLGTRMRRQGRQGKGENSDTHRYNVFFYMVVHK